LPNSAVIAGSGKIEDMLWISDLGVGGPRRDLAEPYRLAPSMTGLMYRYDPDRWNFQALDKFLVYADIETRPAGRPGRN
jgi:hypothetical protein